MSAKVEYLLSPEDVKNKSVEELNEIVRKQFAFDNFRSQKEKGLVIADEHRAEGLERVLYKCPNCLAEGKTVGAGSRLTCKACGKAYELTELGEICAVDGKTEITHIPDWYRWEREEVKKELEAGTYRLDVPVDIRIMVDTKSVYDVGEGRLLHDGDGFHLTGCDGKLDYRQGATAVYTINADFFWYQIADTINIGDFNVQYFCFPKTEGVPVIKTRLAAEELFKLKKTK